MSGRRSPWVPGCWRCWLVEGYGYEITGADVWAAYQNTMRAAERTGSVTETVERISRWIVRHDPDPAEIAELFGVVTRDRQDAAMPISAAANVTKSGRKLVRFGMR